MTVMFFILRLYFRVTYFLMKTVIETEVKTESRYSIEMIFYFDLLGKK